VSTVLKVKEVLTVLKESQELAERKVSKVQQETKGLRVLLGTQETKEI
jgi:hypothetical protein